MGGFDLVGIVVVLAGVAVAVAGVMLTPAKQVVLNALRSRRASADGTAQPAEAEMPAPAYVPIPAQPAVVTQAVAAQTAANGDHREQEALFARTLLTAQKTAEDLVRNAQAEAEQILAKARRDADLIVQTTDQQAAAWLAQLRAEADRLVADAHQAFLSAQRSVEQSVDLFDSSRPAFRVPDWGGDLFSAALRPRGIDTGTATEWRPTRIA
jgi:vacuolar-type H+-ATPase subunit H